MDELRKRNKRIYYGSATHFYQPENFSEFIKQICSFKSDILKDYRENNLEEIISYFRYYNVFIHYKCVPENGISKAEVMLYGRDDDITSAERFIKGEERKIIVNSNLQQ